MYLKSTLADISRARIQLAIGAFLPAWTTKCFKDRGWISISKAPLQTVTVKSREVEDRRDRVEPIYSLASGRIFLLQRRVSIAGWCLQMKRNPATSGSART